MKRAIFASLLVSTSCSMVSSEGLLQPQVDASLPLATGVPTSPRDLSSLSWWTLSANEEHRRSNLSQVHGTSIEQWIPTGVTVAPGQVDAETGMIAAQVMEDSSFGAHAINIGWTGTALAHGTIVTEIIAKSIGDVQLWFRDAWDNQPTYHAQGASVSVVAGPLASASAEALGSGWVRYRLLSRDSFERFDSNYALEIGMRDSAGDLEVQGDPNRGVLIHSVTTYQYGQVVRVADQMSTGAVLAPETGSGLEYRVSGLIGQPDVWAPSDVIGILGTASPSLVAAYAAGRSNTTVFTLGVDSAPPRDVNLMLSDGVGRSFNFGITTDLRIWCGVYGTRTFVSSSALALGRQYVIAVVNDRGRVSIFADGALIASGTFSSSAAPNAVRFIAGGGRAMGQMAVWGKALASSEVQLVTRFMRNERSSSPTPIELGLDELEDSVTSKRLAYSEYHFRLTGSDGLLTVEAESGLPVGVYDRPFGPSVWADGIYVGSMPTPAMPGAHRYTFAIPSNTSEVVVRNGPCADNWAQSYATRVTATGASMVDVQAPQHRLLVIGDSVANGWNSSNPGVEGWAPGLKSASDPTHRVTIWGSGGYALATEAVVPGWYPEFPNELELLLDGSTTNTLVFALGINDAMSGVWNSGGGGAAGFAAAAFDVIDWVHSYRPDAQIAVWGAHRCTNALGSAEGTVAPYREALRAQAATRPWCGFIDASQWTVEMDDLDFTALHPNAAGHATLRANMAGAIGWPLP